MLGSLQPTHSIEMHREMRLLNKTMTVPYKLYKAALVPKATRESILGCPLNNALKPLLKKRGQKIMTGSTRINCVLTNATGCVIGFKRKGAADRSFRPLLNKNNGTVKWQTTKIAAITFEWGLFFADCISTVFR